MHSDPEIRLYRPGDEAKIIQLLEEIWGGWPKFDLPCSSIEHWRWKYQRSSSGEYPIAVAVSNNKMIGCNHSILLNIKIGDKTFLGTVSTDTAVHSEFRNKGVWENMRKLTQNTRRREGVAINYVTSANPIVIRSNSRQEQRYRFPLDVLHLVRIQDMGYHLKKNPLKKTYLKKILLVFLKRKYTLQRFFRRSKSPGPLFTIRNIACFDERTRSFWNEAKDHYFFIIERDPDYLTWRHGDPRGGSYSIKIVERDEKLLGYIILKINNYNKEYPSGHIVDLLTLPDRLDVAEALVKDSIKYFVDKKVNTIHCMISKKHPFEEIYRRNLFMGWKAIPLFYDEYERIDGLESLATTHPKRIYLSAGDFDFI